MTLSVLSTLLLSGIAAGGQAEFQAPFRLLAEGVPVRVEAPGYACPCWVDFDGDGKKDLVVGQFKKGKMSVYKNLGDGKLAAAQWVSADGKALEVPGVW